MKIEPVQARFVEHYWPRVEPMVASAVRQAASLWAADDVLSGLLDRRLQMWLVSADDVSITGLMITEVYDTAAGLTCAIPVVAGERMADSLDALRVIEAWAKDQGCVRLRGEGRAGWERALKPMGWSVVTTQVEKRI